MPTRVSTPFGSRWERDAFDQGDEFSATMDQRQREMALARLDRLGEIGRDNDWRMAQLREGGRQFDLGRQDNSELRKMMVDSHMADLGFGREQLGFQRETAGKEWDYRKGRDDREEAWRKTLYDEDRPTRDANTKLMLAALARMESDKVRQDKAANVAPLGSLTPQEQAKQAATIAAGGTQAQANLATMEDRNKRGYEDADALGDDLGTAAKDFSERDNARVGWDPEDSEDAQMVMRVRALEKQYRDLGDSPAAAKAKAVKKFKENVNTGMNSGHVDFVLKSLGIR